MSNPSKYLSVIEVAQELCVSRSHVYRLIAKGAITARHFGAVVRVTREDLARYQAVTAQKRLIARRRKQVK